MKKSSYIAIPLVLILLLSVYACAAGDAVSTPEALPETPVMTAAPEPITVDIPSAPT